MDHTSPSSPHGLPKVGQSDRGHARTRAPKLRDYYSLYSHLSLPATRLSRRALPFNYLAAFRLLQAHETGSAWRQGLHSTGFSNAPGNTDDHLRYPDSFTRNNAVDYPLKPPAPTHFDRLPWSISFSTTPVSNFTTSSLVPAKLDLAELLPLQLRVKPPSAGPCPSPAPLPSIQRLFDRRLQTTSELVR